VDEIKQAESRSLIPLMEIVFEFGEMDQTEGKSDAITMLSCVMFITQRR
jgi:hypothetical protein